MIARSALALLAVAGFLAGCKDTAHGSIASTGDDEDEASCERYLANKQPYLIRKCLDGKHLAGRVAEARAVLAQASKARIDAVARLDHANPAVRAMLVKWVAARADEPSLAIAIHVGGGDPVEFPGGVSHASSISPDTIVGDVSSMARERLPGIDIVSGSGCAQPSPALAFDLTYAIHDSGDTATLESGSTTTIVHVLAYDIDLVACYAGEQVSVASIRGRAMPLRPGYSVESDPGSAEYLAQQEMDRNAESLMAAQIIWALGVQ